MFGAGKLESGTEVVRVTAQGLILRVAFSGVHRDGVGHLVGDYLVETLKQHQPAAVVLDFSQFKYRSGNDIGGIVQAFFRKHSDGKVTIRPSAIVATGSTATALMSLLQPTKILDVCSVCFFPDVNSAVDHLQTRLDPATA